VSSAPQPSDHHDALTQLPNRRLFAGFSPLPEDAVREAAGRLGAALRKGDTLARWGAGEFALLLIDVADEAQCRADAARGHARQLGRRHYRIYAR
jgi:GGDEF domain-containing protein